MPESSKHMMFVDKLLEEAKKIIPQEYHVLIYTDKPESIQKPPRTKDGFVPDLFYSHNDLQIIGEAKTAEDVEREHSLSQYQSYFEEAIKFKGKSILIFASPWFTKSTLKNIVRSLNKQFNVKIESHFLCEVGESEII